MKTSLHASGEWHMAFDGKFLEENANPEEWSSRFVTNWKRPDAQAPETTLAYRIITFSEAVNSDIDANTPSELVWIEPPGCGSVAETVLIITAPHVKTSGWPGKNMGNTRLVGSFELDRGDTVWLVTRSADEPSLTLNVNRKRFFHGKRADELDTENDLRALIVGGQQPDGSRVLYEATQETLLRQGLDVTRI